MGTIIFRLPPHLPTESRELLQLAVMAGGFDYVPGPTQVRINHREMLVKRPVEESGFLLTPWRIDAVGTVMIQTTTLIERDEPYILSLELLRGKLNQIRQQMALWTDTGVDLPEAMNDELRQLNRQFAKVLARFPEPGADEDALLLLSQACQFVDRSMNWISEQQRRLRLSHELPPVSIGCAIASPPSFDESSSRFDHFRMELSWRAVEPTESRFNWESGDSVINWAKRSQMPLSAGPLVNFSTIGIPDWLWIWHGDLANLAHFMCDYVEAVVTRYRPFVQRWLVCSGCNVGGALGFGEDEMLWLTTRLVESVRQVAPEAELVVGVSQPWGDYMSRDEHTYSPVVFLDTLLRANLRLAGIELEIIPGVLPQGSYWRDLLDTSRLLDQFADLGMPVEMTLGIPASAEPDPIADPDARVIGGDWTGEYSPQVQADRAMAMLKLAASKPYVSHFVWSHYSDAVPHRHPHCGLLDRHGFPRPVYWIFDQFRGINPPDQRAENR